MDKDEVVSNGAVSESEKHLIVDRMDMKLGNKGYLGKHELMIMDLLQNNHWKRPIYYAVTVGSDSYLSLGKYLSLEGMAYRVLPKTGGVLARGGEYVNTERTYDNLMHKFKWGGIAENPDIYMDENNLRMTSTLRYMFVRLCDALTKEAHQAELEKDYCDVLRWALTQDPVKGPDNASYMGVYRAESRIYYDNDRISNGAAYSDSFLLASARSVAAELLAVPVTTPINEMIDKLQAKSNSYDSVAVAKIVAEKYQKVENALDYCQKVLPIPQIPYTTANLMMARNYMQIGKNEKSLAILDVMEKTSLQYLNWFSKLNPRMLRNVKEDFTEQLSVFAEILQMKQTMGIEDESRLDDYNLYMSIYKRL